MAARGEGERAHARTELVARTLVPNSVVGTAVGIRVAESKLDLIRGGRGASLGRALRMLSGIDGGYCTARYHDRVVY